jgi:ribosomal protein S18 acetylase RimI-like enzyme
VGALVDTQCVGIVRKLLQQEIAFLRSIPHVEQLQLSVVSTNDAARKLYTSMGFVSYGYEKRALKWDGSYVNLNHMVKHIRTAHA